MGIAAVLPLGVFFATAMVVAVRLLRLSRRTRQLPEFSIGAGVVLIAALGLPLSAAGRIPATVGTPLGNVVFAVGLYVACAGIALLFVFTWSVFRAGPGWARTGVCVAAVLLAVLATGLIHAGSQGGALADILPRTRPWAIGIVTMLVLAFGWTGVESIRCYRQLQRRQQLGLGDPVVMNRFLLWGIGAWTAVFLCVAIAGFLHAGVAVLVDPVGLTTMALAGVVMSATWYLTFLPPESYLRFVQERA